MVYVDEPLATGAVLFLKIKPTDHTRYAVLLDTCRAGLRITFMGIHIYLFGRSF